ncbi:MAG: 30S ribosomal protein S8 [Candidatus Chisholmbacteria bacterium]|nr:30S ribosomal protein S8 [Candidatus Chisholmbacteria bacterium]
MTDPIADTLTRIRNAYLARRSEISMPHSKLKEALMRLLQKEQYVSEVKVIDQAPQRQLQVTLLYVDKFPAITEIKRVSKPGRRVYIRQSQLKPILSGQGIAIISTSKGLISNKEAKKQKLGGELLCTVS